MSDVIVDCGIYRRGTRVADPVGVRAALAELDRTPDAFCWLGLHEPGEAELAEVAEGFGLHQLAVEDALEAHQRPKLEVYDDMIFVVLKALRYDDASSSVDESEIAVFLGDRFVVTVRHGESRSLAETRSDLEDRASVLGHGPAAVLYAICDHVVDGYGDIAAELELDVDELEQSVFSADRTSDAPTIYRLKRQVLACRRAMVPLTVPMNRLAGGMVQGVPPDTAPFFRDVADHVLRVVDQVEALDNLLSDALSAHLAGVSVQQNEDMRRISAWVAIVAVPTMIAGIYGMNFRHMPGLHTSYGYPVVLGTMVLICPILYRLFKRAGWL